MAAACNSSEADERERRQHVISIFDRRNCICHELQRGTRKLTDPITIRCSQRIGVSVVVGQKWPVCKTGVMQEMRGSNAPFRGVSRSQYGCKATTNVVRSEFEYSSH